MSHEVGDIVTIISNTAALGGVKPLWLPLHPVIICLSQLFATHEPNLVCGSLFPRIAVGGLAQSPVVASLVGIITIFTPHVLDLIPARGEVPIVVPVRIVAQVIVLANVQRLLIVLTIRRVVTQASCHTFCMFSACTSSTGY